LEKIDSRILYASLLLITVLAIATHLSPEKTYSLITVFLIVVIALGNISYLYRKFKKPVK
jgi:hypothetical protein